MRVPLKMNSRANGSTFIRPRQDCRDAWGTRAHTPERKGSASRERFLGRFIVPERVALSSLVSFFSILLLATAGAFLFIHSGPLLASLSPRLPPIPRLLSLELHCKSGDLGKSCRRESGCVKRNPAAPRSKRRYFLFRPFLLLFPRLRGIERRVTVTR